MSDWIAALPMYDWPETREATDALWAALSAALRSAGIDAPARLARRNSDLLAVADGAYAGALLASNPESLPPDSLDLHALWQHPRLLLAQTCWGPLGQGLASLVHIVGQPDYSAYEGGGGIFYSSAIVMRAEPHFENVVPPADGKALLVAEALRGRRLAYNSADSMSGILALASDLKAMGENLDLFSARIETGGHRASICAVTEGRADVAAVDCRSWAMAKRFEPTAAGLIVVGWTGRRKGLPFISGRAVSREDRFNLRKALVEFGIVLNTYDDGAEQL
jgi:ABC-type phosphate/phosphonate transport system substrate-binding protein